MLEQGLEAVAQAVAIDAGGDPDAAIPGYLRGLATCSFVHKNETDPTRKAALRAKLEPYVVRCTQHELLHGR
eukprot:COSAG02_NODE_1348_length_13137_cov_10.847293_3_plen_72_part_00